MMPNRRRRQEVRPLMNGHVVRDVFDFNHHADDHIHRNRVTKKWILFRIFCVTLILFLTGNYLYQLLDQSYDDVTRCSSENCNEFSIDWSTLVLQKWTNNYVGTSDLIGVHRFYIYNISDIPAFKDRIESIRTHSRPNQRISINEIGPYTFNTRETKKRIEFLFNEKTIKYDQQTSYQFNESASIGSLEQKYWVINNELAVIGPYLSKLFQQLAPHDRQQGLSFQQRALSKTILDIFYSNILVERSVKRILYGPDWNEPVEFDYIHLQRLERLIGLRLVDDFLVKRKDNLPVNVSDEATLQISYILQQFDDQFQHFVQINEFLNLINSAYDNRLDQIPDVNSKFLRTSIGFLNSFQRPQHWLISMEKRNVYPAVIEWNGRRNIDHPQKWCDELLLGSNNEQLLFELNNFIPQLCGTTTLLYDISHNSQANSYICKFRQPRSKISMVQTVMLNVDNYCPRFKQQSSLYEYDGSSCHDYRCVDLANCFGGTRVRSQPLLETDQPTDVEFDTTTGLMITKLEHYLLSVGLYLNTIHINPDFIDIDPNEDFFAPMIRNIHVQEMYNPWNSWTIFIIYILKTTIIINAFVMAFIMLTFDLFQTFFLVYETE
ncbi:uncharacterized protein LOC124499275 isoform X2 [Dermatophagoides farinae]|uniref:uncharacterized protein LOC124499275 isoform X2 n=1 Tax=Dermatophagoides farinae TaxID=6954 RepID=UPI001F10A8C9|nr:uncharacterized protein LOC124499275 [Dermatophagoides farinae]